MMSIWRRATRNACLALLLLVTACPAWAEFVAEYDFRVILVKDKEMIDQVQARLQAGTDFGEMAKRVSIDRNSAANGGLMEAVQIESLSGAFASELKRLKEGQRSVEPRMSEFGWFVLKVESIAMVEVDDEESEEEAAEREKQEQLQEEKNAQAKADFEEANEKFVACARHASDLEGEQKELKRRTDMFNLGSSYSEANLRKDWADFKRSVASFNRTCKGLRYNEKILKVCSHPAYQSEWCRRFE